MSPIERLLESITYVPTNCVKSSDSDLPYVTHEGIFKLNEVEIKVVVLSDGRKIIPQEELDKIFKL
jgi:hypothetical protein